MSAFEVDDHTIDIIVTAAFDYSVYPGVGVFEYHDEPMPQYDEAYHSGQPWGDIRGIQAWLEEHRHQVRRSDATRIGAILRAENRRSVNFRYAEDDLEPVYEYTRVRRHDLNPWHVLRSLSTYTYQACEHPGWPRSAAFQICKKVRDLTIEQLMRIHEGEEKCDACSY